MKEVKITINEDGTIYYKNYWIDFNNIECYKSDMKSNKRFNWIDDRELVIYYNQCNKNKI